MCIYNQIMKNQKYAKNKKNGGIIPPCIDKRIQYVPTKCGKCIECRKQYAREWLIRLLEDIKTNTNGKFITLTFSNESIKEICELEIKKKIDETDIYNIKTKKAKKIPVYKLITIKDLTGYEKDNTIATKAVRLFTERWREKFKTAPRHWLITELGHNGTENIHLHGIIWTNETYQEIHKLWKYGYIWPRPNQEKQTYVNSKTVKYITKYISKQDLQHKEYRGKVLTSQGIGENYIKTMNAKDNKFKDTDTEETYTTTTGHKIAMPIYYRNKIYTQFQRELLWINKLDKEERWVLGKKIDVSKNDKEYKAAVQHARQLNTELGYGQRTNENRKEYEEQRREIMIQTRIQKASKQK